ncbi:MAG: hypothetical protein ACK5Y2_11415 [Bdellovibrionales bacterium]
MSKSSCLAFLMSLLVLVSAQAQSHLDPSQFSGEWQGSGIYSLSGEHHHCPVFFMKFQGSRWLMNFEGGHRECGPIREKFAPVGMAYDKGQLYYNGRVVGEVKGNVLEARFSMPEGNGRVRHWRMSLRREGDTIVYEESRTLDNATTPLISFAGLLKKVKPGR